MNVEPLLRGVDEAPGPDEAALGEPQQPRVDRVPGRGHDLVEGQVVLAEASRIHLDRRHLDALAPDEHVRDAGHA